MHLVPGRRSTITATAGASTAMTACLRDMPPTPAPGASTHKTTNRAEGDNSALGHRSARRDEDESGRRSPSNRPPAITTLPLVAFVAGIGESRCRTGLDGDGPGGWSA